jgi:uncharacterized membrane protein
VTTINKLAVLDRDRTSWRRLIILASVFCGLTLIFGLHRYYSFTATYDQGVFNQVFWNNLHGRWFQSSLSSLLSTNVIHDRQVADVAYRRLGQHFTPALLLWLPLYGLFPSPATLVVLQSVLITAGGVVLYFLARHHLPPALSLMITASYYGANAVLGPVVANFHDLGQIPLFLFSLLLAMERRIWWLFWLLASLSLLIREDTGVVLCGVGIYMIISRRFVMPGLILGGLSFSYILMVTNLIMPLFSADISRRFMMEQFGAYTQGNEASTLEVLWHVFTNPALLFYHALIESGFQKFFYVIAQSLSLLFVPLISWPSWAIAGLPLLQIFLQQDQDQAPLSVHSRYALSVVPGFFYGAILWWSQNKHQFQLRRRRLWRSAIVLSIVIGILYNPHQVFSFVLPDSFQPWVYVPLQRQWQHGGHIRHLRQQIPTDASVSATTQLIPSLSSRRGIVRLPAIRLRDDQQQVVEVSYLFADLWRMQQYQVAFRSERRRLQETLTLFDGLLSGGRYGVVDVEDGVVLLSRGVASDPQAQAAWLSLHQTLKPLPL